MTEADRFQTVGTRRAHADAATVTEFLSRTGYQLPIAVADLLDNAIDAGATRVAVCLVLSAGRPAMLAIADNGRGMTPNQLERAVSLEKDPTKQDGASLGRYGAGLKAASFSLGRVLNVVTKTADGAAHGAVLDQARYRSEFEYDLLAPNVCAAVMQSPWGGEPLGPSGTVLLIADLAAMVPRSDSSQDLFLNAFQEELETRVGLVFHRYIESRRLRITKSKRTLGGGFMDEFEFRDLEAVNPFGYPHSGHAEYPKDLTVNTGHSDVPVTLHLWPKQGRTKATRHRFYDILGRSGEWQGLYFYRLDRLLQQGGWNGLRGQEPHTSYARIAVELPRGSDDEFRPTVMKDRIENARPLLGVLTRRREWNEYIAAATTVYRSRTSETQRRKDEAATTQVAPRPKFRVLPPGLSMRINEAGALELDRHVLTALGQARADAIAEIVWQATREVTPRQRFTPKVKQDLEYIERALSILARKVES